jgi:N-acetylmuramoyl-L-alanine amidase
MGVRVVLTRGWDTNPTDAERAELANEVGADVVLSLHTDATSSPRCQGVASYHFGTGTGTTSTMGERLASLVQREVVARTGLVDCRVHPKTWTLLRMTQMPCVRLELGHLTNREDAAQLGDPSFRDTVAEALLVAVQRLYLPNELDPPTGALRLPVGARG